MLITKSDAFESPLRIGRSKRNSWPLRRALTLAGVATSLTATLTPAFADGCQAQSSGPTITPVIELYTSEGCSSCPPAERWLSTLKSQAQQGHVVVQAFHVGYWDYIGWADRFAKPAFTA